MQKYANLVGLEKCCQTHIFLQNFVLIQPRTSPPTICKFSKMHFRKCIFRNAFSKMADEVPRPPEELRHGRPRAELAPPHRRGARRRPRRSPAIPAKVGNIRHTLAKFGERSRFVNGFIYTLLLPLTNGTRTSSEVSSCNLRRGVQQLAICDNPDHVVLGHIPDFF